MSLLTTPLGARRRSLLSAAGGGGGTTDLVAESPSVVLKTNSADFELGWSLTTKTGVSLTAVGMRIYCPEAVGVTLRLWASGGTLLRSVAVTTVVDTWVEGTFSTPYSVGASEGLVLSYNKGTGLNWYDSSSTSAASTDFLRSDIFTRGNSRFNLTPGAFPSGEETAVLRGIVDLLITEP